MMTLTLRGMAPSIGAWILAIGWVSHPAVAGVAQQFSPSSLTPPAKIKPLPMAAGWVYPWVVTISGGTGHGIAYEADRGASLRLYNPQPGAWAGAGLSYDHYGTSAIETGNLSGLSQLVVGMALYNGTAPTHVKLELVDDRERKGFVHLVGIESAERVWVVPTAVFSAQGVDLSRVRTVYFIVETLASFQAFSNFRFHVFPPGSRIRYPATVLPLDPEESNWLILEKTVRNRITLMPGNPIKTHMAPAWASSGGPGTVRGQVMQYATGSGGWVAGGWTFDDFDTPAVETQDLSRYRLAVGIKGDAPTLKLEVIDYLNRKMVGYLRGIERDAERVWEVFTAADAALHGIDATKIRMILFVVEGHHRTGSLTLHNRPTPVAAESSLSRSAINFPISPAPQSVPIVPVGATGSVLPTSRGMQLTCQTGSAGWAGGGFLFDNPATSIVETADFSYTGKGTTDTPLRYFGVQGSLPGGSLKIEFVDAQERKAAYTLGPGVSSAEQIWGPNSEWARYHYGLDMSRIKVVYFIVEGVKVQADLLINRLP